MTRCPKTCDKSDPEGKAHGPCELKPGHEGLCIAFGQTFDAAPEPPMTRCPNIDSGWPGVSGTCQCLGNVDHRGPHWFNADDRGVGTPAPRDSTFQGVPEALALHTPAPSLLDFEAAHRAGVAALTHKDGPTRAEHADLNTQAAALVATAKREERHLILNRIREVFIRYGVSASQFDAILKEEARDDHR